ncbi:MAG: DnaJ domain-containing protein [Cytophagales bacterium]|nr:DnaJ domain-containing protein [Armatimonadota bacterium]
MSSTSSGGDNPEDKSALPNHYEVLGVDEEASESDIKSAYFRLVREYRPQENPEDFQRFNDASATLSDPRRRGAYDQNRRNGRRMQVLVDQAANSLDKDPQKAIALLKNAIAMAPDVPRPRALLAQVLTRIEEYEGAEKQYRWLIRDNPRDETIRFKLARCLWLQERLGEAEAELRGALKVNARYHDALILLSRLQEIQEQNALAAQTLEQAIANDNRENYADTDALLRLFVLYLLVGDLEEAAHTEQRLLAVIPGDASPRTDKAVKRILRRANELYQAEKFQSALRLVDCAAQRTLGSPEATEQAETLYRAVTLRNEARQLQADRLAEGALKAYLELRYLDRAPETLRQKLDVLLSRLMGEIALKPREIVGTVDYLRRQYPTIAAEQERLLAELYDRATKRIVANAAREAENAAMPDQRDLPPGGGGAKRGGLLGWLRGGGDSNAK